MTRTPFHRTGVKPQGSDPAAPAGIGLEVYGVGVHLPVGFQRETALVVSVMVSASGDQKNWARLPLGICPTICILTTTLAKSAA